MQKVIEVINLVDEDEDEDNIVLHETNIQDSDTRNNLSTITTAASDPTQCKRLLQQYLSYLLTYKHKLYELEQQYESFLHLLEQRPCLIENGTPPTANAGVESMPCDISQEDVKDPQAKRQKVVVDTAEQYVSCIMWYYLLEANNSQQNENTCYETPQRRSYVKISTSLYVDLGTLRCSESLLSTVHSTWTTKVYAYAICDDICRKIMQQQ